MYNKNPKYQKFIFLHTGKLSVHYAILSSALITSILFFKAAQCPKVDFLIQSKGIPSTYISASVLLRYSFYLTMSAQFGKGLQQLQSI